MKVSINRQVVNKSTEWEILATGFENMDLSQAQLASEINQGHAFSTHHQGRRQQENFLVAGYVALDFDRASQAEKDAIMVDPLVAAYHSIFYFTPSSTPEAPRFRVVFELEQPVHDGEYYRQIMAAFIWKFGANADQSCKDPCRLFYGSKDSEPIFTDKVLPMSVVAEVVKAHRQHTEQERQDREAADRERRKVTGPSGANSDKGKKAYIAKILDTHCDRLRQASKGERHFTLIKSARVMGGYLAGEPEASDEHEIRQRLAEAYSVHDGLNRREMGQTLDWGIERGKKEPLYVPDMPIAPAKPSKPTSTGQPVKIDPETGEIQGQDFLFLADYSPDDDGNAEAFLAVYGKSFLFCKAYGWLWWTGTHWQNDLAEQKLFEKVTEILKQRRIAGVQAEKEAVVKCSKPNSSTITSEINLLEKKLEVMVDTFDQSTRLLNCKNGVLDLRTGQLTNHTPEQRFTYCLPTEYHPEAQSAVWDNFLKTVVGGGPDVLDYLQKALGYTLTGQTTEECLFYLYGPSRSGKGTLTEVLMVLMGRPLSAEADFNTFTARRDGDSNNFDLAPLKPARAVFASESERYQRLNPAKIKQLTGGNMVWCCFKHREHFNYRPQYKLWLSSNWPVNGDVDDDALWGRVRVIEFPNSFLGHEDKMLKLRLKQPENLQAAFAWLVEGAKKWYAAPNGLVTPEEVKKSTAKQREEADFIQSWLDENCEQDTTAWESNADIYANYERWCKSNGVEAKQMRNLTASLKTKGYVTNVQRKLTGTVSKGIQGIRLLTRYT